MDESEIKTQLSQRYALKWAERIGRGVRMDFYVGESEYGGEPRILLMTVNPNTGFVGGIYALTLPVARELCRVLGEKYGAERAG